MGKLRILIKVASLPDNKNENGHKKCQKISRQKYSFWSANSPNICIFTYVRNFKNHLRTTSKVSMWCLTFQNRVCLSGPNGFQKDHFVFINSKHVTMPKNPTSFFKKMEYKRAIICEETFQRKWKYGLFFEALRHGKRITSILWALSFTNQLSRFHRFTWPHIFFRSKFLEQNLDEFRRGSRCNNTFFTCFFKGV